MKSKTIKSFLLFLALTFVMIAAACGQSQTSTTEEAPANEPAEQEPAAKKKLLVGTDAAYPPFENIEAGEIVGFDVDLITAVMEQAGYEFEIQHTGWEPLFQMVTNGSVDVGISAITITEDRQKTYDFSTPYFEASQMILVPEGSDVKNYQDLKDKVIGVQNGTTGDFKAQELLGEKSTDIKKYETTPLAIMAMINGESEAVIADNVVVQEYVANNPDAKVVAIEDPDSFESEYYGLMFKKGNDSLREELSTAVQTVIDNGKYAEIYKQWFGYEPDIEKLKQ
ncbi:basic amino acid ABC transporter substrate-binding protein [Calidifontibacillus oryziterrae]|uniref:basic amino acid ABC transporter substrate-binding protein n=1 Tax=Calidifontibacillus oryziterrae TaxID=1191699 RepID=UPI0002FE28BD|nr:basic amino acid ABC transporter substrate-binding protein [Calidifontibacillus oryziterrae]